MSLSVVDPAGPLVFTMEAGQHLPTLVKHLQLYLREMGMAEEFLCWSEKLSRVHRVGCELTVLK